MEKEKDSKKEKPFIIPIFIPHAGCPHQCIYCNQRIITGEANSFASGDDVRRRVFQFLSFPRKAFRTRTYIAFYGGSFTALPYKVQKELLGVAEEFVGKGLVSGIRFSTRPDCINEGETAFLKRFSVAAVELGAQSMDNRVLMAAARGHDSEETRKASRLIKRHKWELGIQLMVGLPKENENSFRFSIQQTVKLEPNFVRLYPTLVIKDTPLARLYKAGKYEPLSLNKAVELCAWAHQVFRAHGITVIRTGLQAEPWLNDPSVVLAGPYHPSFGELVHSAYLENKITKVLMGIKGQGNNLKIVVPRSKISQVCGQKSRNISKWKNMFGFRQVTVSGSKHLHGHIILSTGKWEKRIEC